MTRKIIDHWLRADSENSLLYTSCLKIKELFVYVGIILLIWTRKFWTTDIFKTKTNFTSALFSNQ